MQINEDNFKLKINSLFNELGIRNDQPLLIHSSLYELYKLEKPANKLWEFLSEYMNKSVGFAIPTYCLSGESSYKPTRTESSVGAFSQYALQKPKGIRTLCPIHNHLFFNEKDIIPSEMNFYASFGLKTDFDFLLRKNYKLLLFAVNFDQACSYIHNIEYLANVPYRKIIYFNRQIINEENSKILNIKFKYFARIDNSINTDFNKVIPHLKNCSTYRKSKLSIFNSYAISLKELHDTILKLLKENSKILLK